MGRLIIDGNSVFEIDEQCLKKKRISKSCGIDKYIEKAKCDSKKKNKKK